MLHEPLISSSIICWTHTLIKVRVPSVSKFSPDSSDLGKYAGTGRVRVFNSESLLPATSPEPITVRFSAKNKFTKSTETPASVSLKQTLREANNNGGFTLTIGSSLSTDVDAKARFLEALKTWKCATKINFDTTSLFANTGGLICLIDIGTVPSGALGTTQESYYRCKLPGTSGNFVRTAMAQFTMIFSNSVAFYKGSDPLAIGSSQYDFEAVALHELGHAHALNHVNQSDDVMFYANGMGLSSSAKRNLNPDAIEAGLYIMGISKVSYPGTNCSFDPMSDTDVLALGCSTPIFEPFAKQCSFSVSPNPAEDQIVITAFESLNEMPSCHIKIVNLLGNTLLEKKISFYQNSDRTCDISELNEGIYFVIIEAENHSLQSVKMIKR